MRSTRRPPFNQARLTRLPRLVIERRYTRDARAPLVEGDDDLEYGWQSVPVPPWPDDGWVIFDTRKDFKTGWRRIRLVGAL